MMDALNILTQLGNRAMELQGNPQFQANLRRAQGEDSEMAAIRLANEKAAAEAQALQSAADERSATLQARQRLRELAQGGKLSESDLMDLMVSSPDAFNAYVNMIEAQTKAVTPKLQFNPVTGEMFDMRTGQPWGGGGGGGLPDGGNIPPETVEEDTTPEAFNIRPAPTSLSPKGRQEWEKAEIERVRKLRESAPTVTQNLEQTASLIDQMLQHPGFESSVGAKGASSLFGLMDEPFAGTEAAGFNSIFNQVQGKQFLAAFQELKGAGAITEKEGTKATEAYSRLSRSTTEAEFRKASQELKDVLSKGYKRLTGRPLQAAVIPQGVTQEEWSAMTPEEKAVFQ